MVYRGYVDESYSKDLFALSCLIARGKDWMEMERAWKLCLNAKNKELKRQGRKLLRRYHATDCNGKHKDFEGWSDTEQIEFVKGLLGTFKRTRGVHAVGYVLNLDDLCQVFTETDDRIGDAYYLLTRFMMQTIGDDFVSLGDGAPAKITLFHDRTANGKYDGTILKAFNRQIGDGKFEHSEYFTTIASLGWEDCIALQPADLVAFEAYKYAERTTQPRKSFTALLDLPQFGIHVKNFSKAALEAMRSDFEASIRLKE